MRIHEQNKALKNQVNVLMDGIQDLKSYLNSSKFEIDTNVNKNDILLRIEEIKTRFNEFDSGLH